MSRTWIGFGFGPIQSALFLFEAWKSGNFSRLVCAEVDNALIDAIRASGGRYTVNIAHPDAIEQVTVTGVELYNPTEPEGRKALVRAIAEACEGATALPSVRFYDLGEGASVARLLAEGINLREPGKRFVVYTAENHNHAAEILLERLREQIGPRNPAFENVQFLNTVVGKMSGMITGAEDMGRLGLAPMVEGSDRAVLVEAFNRILVSRVRFDDYTRGIDVFEEKDDLLPFEEAKLFGHNAIHALMAYLAGTRGFQVMSQCAADPLLMAICRESFLRECGETLIRRYGAMGDPLFTQAGWEHYADDLLQRMVNPHLNDLVDRVSRDPIRKLGLDDRLFGTMHLALQYGVVPRCLALGAAAAVLRVVRREQTDNIPPHVPVPNCLDSLTIESLEKMLVACWGDHAKACGHTTRLVELCWEACEGLRAGSIRC